MLFASTQAKRGSDSLASKSSTSGAPRGPYKEKRGQLTPSQAPVDLRFSQLLSQDRLGHRGGVPRGAWSVSSRVPGVKHRNRCLLPPGALEGRNVAGAAGEGWASGDCDEMAQEERIEDPPTCVFTGVRRSSRDSHWLLRFRVNDSDSRRDGSQGLSRLPSSGPLGKDMWMFLSEGDRDDVQSEPEQHPRKLRGQGNGGLHGDHLESRSCLGQMD